MQKQIGDLKLEQQKNIKNLKIKIMKSKIQSNKSNRTMMKKLFLGLSIVASSFAFSQQFGIKGGMNVSSISDDGYDDTKSKVGYYGGVFVNIPASESFSIQPEVIYNNLGSEVKGTVFRKFLFSKTQP